MQGSPWSCYGAISGKPIPQLTHLQRVPGSVNRRDIHLTTEPHNLRRGGVVISDTRPSEKPYRQRVTQMHSLRSINMATGRLPLNQTVRHHSPMCDFISIAVPKKATDALSKWRRRYYALSPHDNPTLRTHLPPGYSTWVLTHGGCSCELCVSVGSPPRKASATLEVMLREDASEIFQEIVAGRDRVFVYVHHYRGDISTEQLPVLAAERRKLDAFGPQTQFRRDSLIELIRR